LDDGSNEVTTRLVKTLRFATRREKASPDWALNHFGRAIGRVQFSGRMVSWRPVRVSKPAANYLAGVPPSTAAGATNVYHHRDVQGWRLILAP